MKKIIFENKYETGIKGLYYGQPYNIDFNLKQDLLKVLTDDEVEEVLDIFYKEKYGFSSMIGIDIGTFVTVNLFEGGEIIEYNIEVRSIEEQGYDDEGNYYCIAYGVGVTEADEEMAEKYTHRLEPSNFASILI